MTADDSNGTKRDLWLGAFILVTVSVAALFAAEGVIRVFAPQPALFFEPALYAPDAELGYHHQAGYVGTLTNTVEYTTAIETNHLGMRNPELRPGPEPRLLLIGDSFVFGQGVERGDTLAARLEERLQVHHPVQVVNGGVRGYGPAEEALWLHRIGPEIQPAIVVVGIYLGNDLQDDMTPVEAKRALLAPPTPWHAVITAPLFEHSHLYRALRGMVDRISGRQADREASSLQRNYGVTSIATYNNTARALDQLAREAQSLHSRVFVVLIPDALQVVPERSAAFAAVQRQHPEWHLDAQNPNRVFATLLEERHIPVLDLTPAFAAAIKSGEHLYLRTDGHWSAAGHRLAAELIAAQIDRDAPGAATESSMGDHGGPPADALDRKERISGVHAVHNVR